MKKLRIFLSVKEIVGLAVATLVISALIPTAFQQFYSVDTSSWGSSVANLWNLIPLMAILGLILGIIAVAVGKTKTKLSVKDIVGVAVAVLITSFIIPTAFTQFYSANTTGWGTSVVSLWGLIPLMVILALVLGFVAMGIRKTKG